jgi:peptidoglycan/xylan/chitin deacetylase (PgdA/CDA1 family)
MPAAGERGSVTPELSVVILTREGRPSLLKTLESLRHQTAEPGRFDIVVVTAGPREDTDRFLRSFAERPEWRTPELRSFALPQNGIAAFHGAGLRISRGRWVLFLDDDMIADQRLVSAHLTRQAASGPPGCVVIGRIRPESGPGALHAAHADWRQDTGQRPPTALAGWNAFSSGNISLPRRAALRRGGFDPAVTPGEDVDLDDLDDRLQASGLRSVYAPEAAVHACDPKPSAALLIDRARAGHGAVLTYRTAPRALAALALGRFGATRLRLRLARGVLLTLDRLPLAAQALDLAFAGWAASDPGVARRQLFQVAASFSYWRGVRRAATRDEWRRLANPGVPVLLYHSIAANPTGDRFTVEPRRFARQMAFLRWTGRHVESLEEVVAAWDSGRPPPRSTVALTFDDGYRDTLTTAWPVLRKHGFPAALFFVTGLAGGTNTWDAERGLPVRPLLTWDEVRRLDREGFRVHSHSVTHADLRAVDASTVATELRCSLRRLEAELGHPARLFAFPYGHHDPEVDAAVREAGYTAAWSIRGGRDMGAPDRWNRPRVAVEHSDGLLRFALKVWLGQDPLPRRVAAARRR